MCVCVCVHISIDIVDIYVDMADINAYLVDVFVDLVDISAYFVDVSKQLVCVDRLPDQVTGFCQMTSSPPTDKQWVYCVTARSHAHINGYQHLQMHSRTHTELFPCINPPIYG